MLTATPADSSRPVNASAVNGPDPKKRRHRDHLQIG
jgi:hypothetical protein